MIKKKFKINIFYIKYSLDVILAIIFLITIIFFINYYFYYYELLELNLNNIEIKSINLIKDKISGLFSSYDVSYMKKVGDRISNSFAVSKNVSNTSSFKSHLFNYNKFNSTINKYDFSLFKEYSTNNSPILTIDGKEIKAGIVTNKKKIMNQWNYNLSDSVLNHIADKANDIKEAKYIDFTKEELNNRMQLTTDYRRRTEIILNLENDKNPFLCKLFALYKEKNTIEKYECFLLDYYTSNHIRTKVDAIVEEMQNSYILIHSPFIYNNYVNFENNTEEENFIVLKNIILKSYRHLCIYYENDNNKKEFCVFSHSDAIIYNKNNVSATTDIKKNISIFNNNVLSNLYNYHIINDSENLKGEKKVQCTTSFFYQEKEIPEFIKEISNNNIYNDIKNFVNNPHVEKKLKSLLSLSSVSDKDILINKLKDINVIK